MLDDPGAVWALVAEVVDAVEVEVDVLVASVADRVVARMQATNAELAAALHDALRRGVSVAVRDALARLRFKAELPKELLPDLTELAGLCASSGCELAGLPDAWLVGQEVFWDRFQVVADRTLADTALCWDVIKAARARLRGHAARLSVLFRRACERELVRVMRTDEDSCLHAVLRALDGEWVDPGELRYDLAHHHIAGRRRLTVAGCGRGPHQAAATPRPTRRGPIAGPVTTAPRCPRDTRIWASSSTTTSISTRPISRRQT